MLEVLVKFTTQQDAVGLCNALMKYDNVIDVRHNTYLVDGKSILGLMSIGLGKVCTVTIHEHAHHSVEEVRNDILPWIV